MNAQRAQVLLSNMVSKTKKLAIFVIIVRQPMR